MKLVMLGTSGYHPTNFRQTACLMLPEVGVVLDAGTGMFRVRDWLRTSTLDVFLTHAHLDHVVGLTYLFSVLWERQVERVRVHGETAKLAALERHLFAPDLFPARPPFQWTPLVGEVSLPRGPKLTYFPLQHPGGSVGYRLDWPDRSMAYVTDTTARLDAPYLEHIRGVDVLVHECFFADDQGERADATGHSCITSVLDLAAAAQARRLFLLHFNPLSNQAHPLPLEALQHPFTAAEMGWDGMEIEF